MQRGDRNQKPFGVKGLIVWRMCVTVSVLLELSYSEILQKVRVAVVTCHFSVLSFRFRQTFVNVVQLESICGLF